MENQWHEKRSKAEVLALLPVLKKWQYTRPRVGVVVCETVTRD